MEFELFDKIYTAIKEHHEKQSRISDFLESELCSSSFCFCDMGDNLIDLLIELLVREFDDRAEWIEYCLYEKPDKIGDYVFEDEEPIKLNTTKEIYDFLMENKKEYEKLEKVV